MKQPERFTELDVWRGIAIIGMVLFHFFFLLDYSSLADMEYRYGVWKILARTVQLSFLLLLGISLRLAWLKGKMTGGERSQFLVRQWKRGITVFLFGLLITLVTGIIIPDDFVRFGILHFIGISILLLSFFADKPRAAVFLSFLVIGLSAIIQQYPTDIEMLLVVGFPYAFQSVDYFPIFPWLAVPAFGIFLGEILYKDFKRRWSFMDVKEGPMINALVVLGKNSLLIYLLHIPILFAIIRLWVLAF